MKLRVLILVLLLSLPVTRTQAEYATGGIIKTIFSNGATLLVKPEPEARTVAIEVFVRVGAQDESPANTGIGQLLAAALLSGTERRFSPRMARDLVEAGGNFHALWNWNYMEVYAITTPDNYEQAISLIADSVCYPKFDPVAVEFSRSAILKEIRRQESDPYAASLTALRKLVHKGTPYGRAYMGDPDKIRSITREQLREFYYRHINISQSPDRIVISVVGNVDPERVRRKVAVFFKNMQIMPEKPSNMAPVQPAEAEAVIRQDLPTTYVMVGYPAPGVDSREYTAMCVANVLLGGNKSSLLFRKVREERGLGYQVGSQYPDMRGTSLIAAFVGLDSARATPEIVKEAQDAVIVQVEGLKAGEFADGDLERAKRYLIGRHALKHERTRDRAFHLGWAEVVGLGHQHDLLYGDKISAVTREDVLTVCAKYLKQPTVVVLSGRHEVEGLY